MIGAEDLCAFGFVPLASLSSGIGSFFNFARKLIQEPVDLVIIRRRFGKRLDFGLLIVLV